MSTSPPPAPSSLGLGVRGWARPQTTPGIRGALADLRLRPRQRHAAPGSGERARGCPFKLKRERAAGGRARGSARRAPGSVPGLRRSSRLPPRPGRAPGPRRAPPRRARGDTADVAPPATAGLGASACALREAGRERGAGREPEPKPEPERERRPLRGAGVSTRPAGPRARPGYAPRAQMHTAPPPRAGDPRSPRDRTPPPRLHPHAGHSASRAPCPSPATPRTAHRTVPCTPAQRVHTRGSPGHLPASWAPALHARPSHSQHPDCPHCPGSASRPLPGSGVRPPPQLRSPCILRVPAAWVLGFQEMPRVAPHCQEAGPGRPRGSQPPSGVTDLGGELSRVSLPTFDATALWVRSLSISGRWGYRFGLKKGDWGQTEGPGAWPVGGRALSQSS